MAALSSMMRSRRLTYSVRELCTGSIPSFAGDFQDESCPLSGPGTFRAQCAAAVVRRERAAMQTDPMAGFWGGKAVAEELAHFLGRYAHAVIDHRNAHSAFGRFDAQGNELVRPSRLVTCILRVAHEIYQYLQYLVFVDGDGGYLAELALQR